MRSPKEGLGGAGWGGRGGGGGRRRYSGRLRSFKRELHGRGSCGPRAWPRLQTGPLRDREGRITTGLVRLRCRNCKVPLGCVRPCKGGGGRRVLLLLQPLILPLPFNLLPMLLLVLRPAAAQSQPLLLVLLLRIAQHLLPHLQLLPFVRRRLSRLPPLPHLRLTLQLPPSLPLRLPLPLQPLLPMLSRPLKLTLTISLHLRLLRLLLRLLPLKLPLALSCHHR